MAAGRREGPRAATPAPQGLGRRRGRAEARHRARPRRSTYAATGEGEERGKAARSAPRRGLALRRGRVPPSNGAAQLDRAGPLRAPALGRTLPRHGPQGRDGAALRPAAPGRAGERPGGRWGRVGRAPPKGARTGAPTTAAAVALFLPGCFAQRARGACGEGCKKRQRREPLSAARARAAACTGPCGAALFAPGVRGPRGGPPAPSGAGFCI